MSLSDADLGQLTVLLLIRDRWHGSDCTARGRDADPAPPNPQFFPLSRYIKKKYYFLTLNNVMTQKTLLFHDQLRSEEVSHISAAHRFCTIAGS